MTAIRRRARRLGHRLRERPLGRRRPPRISRLVAGENVEDVGGVLDGMRERARGGEALERTERRARDAPARGLEPEQAATGCGDPDGAAAVGRVSRRHESRCKGCRRATARAARRQLEVPGVPGRAIQLRLGERDSPELRRVRLADDDEPGLADPPHDGAVEVRDVIGVGTRRVRRADAGGRCQVLDGDRNPAERCVAVRRVDESGSFERLLSADSDERVQRRIEPCDPLEGVPDELRGGDLATADEPRLLDGREERELHLGEPTSVRKWRGPDLNRRHHGFQPCALPAELPRRGDSV